MTLPESPEKEVGLWAICGDLPLLLIDVGWLSPPWAVSLGLDKKTS